MPRGTCSEQKLLNVPFRVFCCVKDIKSTHTQTHTHAYTYTHLYIYRSTYSIFLCDTHSTTLKKSAPKGPARHNHPRVLTLLPVVRAPRLFLSPSSGEIARGTHPLNTLCAALYLSFSAATVAVPSPRAGRLSVPRRLRTNQTACVQKLHTQSYVYIYICI